jgi:CRISPR-associated protein Cmr2
MNVCHRKLFALLHDPQLKPLYKEKDLKGPWDQIDCLQNYQQELEDWWEKYGGKSADHISAASDRINLRNIIKNAKQLDGTTKIEVRHPLSGQKQEIVIRNTLHQDRVRDIENEAIPYALVSAEQDVEKIYWWFWRFYPEAIAHETGIEESSALILPADTRIPDCPIHTHNSMVSALAGAMFPDSWQPKDKPQHPYLVLFTFSPVQEFIKSSRKFLDFWAGSYLLHYISARLCWYVAEKYGPDAVITPSLWGQEIIDAFLVKKYPKFKEYFKRGDPVSKFDKRESNSLSTAGFPNIIVALAPGKEAAEALGKELTAELEKLWIEIGQKVRSEVRTTVIDKLKKDKESIWKTVTADMPEETKDALSKEFDKWQQESNWEWNKLWDAQLGNTWERYWTAIPLGDPDKDLTVEINKTGIVYKGWKQAQKDLSQSRSPLPNGAEEGVYPTLNVGTWWGSLQARLGQSIQAVKNTRTWKIPAAPGERSTVSGLYSALHPNLLYNGHFREGGGLPTSSMNLFWRVMAQVYPGLFNGSEKLNALELTKRMAWQHGGVADFLGVKTEDEKGATDYENLIRFPNLSSIAAARFAHDYPAQVQKYWRNLERLVRSEFTGAQRDAFYSRTSRAFQVPATDKVLSSKLDKDYNGVMFSSKWLADDMGLQGDDVSEMRGLVEQAHKDSGFGDGSPSDWWVLVLADGDGIQRVPPGICS